MWEYSNTPTMWVYSHTMKVLPNYGPPPLPLPPQRVKQCCNNTYAYYPTHSCPDATTILPRPRPRPATATTTVQ
jgi:hypothetical protein